MSIRKVNRHMRTNRPLAPAAASPRTGVLVTNSILLVAALALLAYYVVQANALAAFQYDIGAYGDQIASLREVHHSLGTKIADQEHPDRIAAFARSAGMVLASDASYVSIPESPLAGR